MYRAPMKHLDIVLEKCPWSWPWVHSWMRVPWYHQPGGRCMVMQSTLLPGVDYLCKLQNLLWLSLPKRQNQGWRQVSSWKQNPTIWIRHAPDEKLLTGEIIDEFSGGGVRVIYFRVVTLLMTLPLKFSSWFCTFCVHEQVLSLWTRSSSHLSSNRLFIVDISHSILQKWLDGSPRYSYGFFCFFWENTSKILTCC